MLHLALPRRADVLLCGLVMAARKRPMPEDGSTARQLPLDGLATDDSIGQIIAGLEPLHPRCNTFPGEVFLGLAGEALDWCWASQREPVPLDRMRERFLPGCTFRGRDSGKLWFAVGLRCAGRADRIWMGGARTEVAAGSSS